MHLCSIDYFGRGFTSQEFTFANYFIYDVKPVDDTQVMLIASNSSAVIRVDLGNRPLLSRYYTYVKVNSGSSNVRSLAVVD